MVDSEECGTKNLTDIALTTVVLKQKCILESKVVECGSRGLKYFCDRPSCFRECLFKLSGANEIQKPHFHNFSIF